SWTEGPGDHSMKRPRTDSPAPSVSHQARAKSAGFDSGSFFLHSSMSGRSLEALEESRMSSWAVTWLLPGTHFSEMHSSQETFAFSSALPAAAVGPIESGTRSMTSP